MSEIMRHYYGDKINIEICFPENKPDTKKQINRGYFPTQENPLYPAPVL